MKKSVMASLMILLMAGAAQALPTLQLDTPGGTYDLKTETIVSSGTSFNLYAYLITDKFNSLSDTYYLSAAVVPKTGPVGSNLGSFKLNGTSYNVTGSMTYGTPPLETLASPFLAATDPGDLASHGVFETFFKEFEFTFDGSMISPYNTQDRAKSGGAIPTSGSGMYYMMFSIDTANLMDGYYIHFDLYNSALAKKSLIDLDISQFAPFSHDLQSNGHKVPEPGTMLLLGSGLLGLGFFGRKKLLK